MHAATDDLGARIAAAAARRATLRPAVGRATRRLAHAQRWLRVLRWPVVRHLSFGREAALAAEVATRSQALDDARARFRESAVAIDFGLDAAVGATYAALTAAFEVLARCDTIWRIDAHDDVDRGAERTIATSAVLRRPVRLTLAGADQVRSESPALSFDDDIFLYPGFLLAGPRVIDVRDLRVTATVGAFVEDRALPGDAERLSPTWQKVNGDGSPDRRFRDNGPLPVARYGELLVRGPGGFACAWMTSAVAPPSSFARAFEDHAWAFAGLHSPCFGDMSRQPAPD